MIILVEFLAFLVIVAIGICFMVRQFIRKFMIFFWTNCDCSPWISIIVAHRCHRVEPNHRHHQVKRGERGACVNIYRVFSFSFSVGFCYLIDFIRFVCCSILVTRSNKTDDDPPPPIFTIANMSNTLNDYNDGEFVDISIEQPPPPYDDIIVVKPPNLLKPVQ